MFFYTDKLNPVIQEYLKQDLADNERDNPFCAILISDYQNEALAIHLESKFPDIDFAQLEKLHKFKQQSKIKFRLITIVTAAFGITTWLLNIVPDGLLKLTGFDLELFRISVFFLTVSFVVTVSAVWIYFWFYLRTIRSNVGFVTQMISYLAIRSSGSST